eukprot:TRINITY_DN45373_c0_g1_i1.p1 TRINITY_DN45373_c0_g1~~TRINITY_DN45373_c0_g1_i1.p1  ORF type:complete len:577 (+),score=128.42 TRINITY_DN45373_c0_g1_i1:82-1731(+)
MSTAADLQNDIEKARQIIERNKELDAQANREVQEAETRQRLRRELDKLNEQIHEQRCNIAWQRDLRGWIDQDVSGPALPEHGDRYDGFDSDDSASNCDFELQRNVLDFSNGVCTGSYTWQIKGLRWMKDVLRKSDSKYTGADEIVVGGESFTFRYNPFGGLLSWVNPCYGTLVIVHLRDDSHGALFRFKMLVRNQQGQFVQWGQTGSVCIPGFVPKSSADVPLNCYGPDVRKTESVGKHNVGVFGLSHDELIESEWVQDDTLTVRFELEVRAHGSSFCLSSQPLQRLKGGLKSNVEIAGPSLSGDLLSLFESAKGSDVTFVVGDQRMPAHSPVLRARCQVFENLLDSGLRESDSKEIVVEDCDPEAFKAVLRFLYSDDLKCVEKMVTGEGVRRVDDKVKAEALQCVLSVSHKYQLGRLRQWCEKELCASLKAETVCAILCQAHLFEARQLERTCLAYIKQNFQEVMLSEAFGVMTSKWAEVALKVNIYVAGVPDNRAQAAMETHRDTLRGKRKREENTEEVKILADQKKSVEDQMNRLEDHRTRIEEQK